MKIRVHEQEYPFPEIDTITYREAALVKKLTGLRFGEFGEAFENGDTDIMVGLAAVAVYRNSGQTDLDYLFNLTLDEIAYVTEESDSELPPTERPERTDDAESSGGETDGPTPASERSGRRAGSNGTGSSRGSSKTSPPKRSRR